MRVALSCLQRLAVLGLLVLLLPSLALAHAQLETTNPERNALLPDPPDAVVLGFNEPANPVALRWISPDGTSTPAHARPNGLTIVIDPPPQSGEGSYLLS